jgi:hypothetical protein
MDMIQEYDSIVQQMKMMVTMSLLGYHLQQTFERYLKHVVMVVKSYWMGVFVMMIYCPIYCLFVW